MQKQQLQRLDTMQLFQFTEFKWFAFAGLWHIIGLLNEANISTSLKAIHTL